jgi:Glyoxalase-like domain
MSLALDHVIICVPDLAEAARMFSEDHGVRAVEGGRHPGHGTANMLIPLGDSYIELLTVVAPDEAKTSPLGTWALHRAAVPGADGVCLRSDDLETLSSERGLQVTGMSRVTPEGPVLQWRVAGLREGLTRGLPFFIQWDVPAHLHPGRLDVAHPVPRTRLQEVTVSGDFAALTTWAPDPEGVTYRSGDPGVTFRLSTAEVL